ncbi:MAG: M48 family metallopeptidase, partial [Burkholderiales bacterium]
MKILNFEPPAGPEITRQEAPRLFAMIEELRRALRAPRLSHVLVSHDFNAAVVQARRLGILGWYSHDLLIGLPLAKVLTVEQFKAVLAHELAHLAKRHGAMSNRIPRQNPLAHANEFEADAASARLVSPGAAAQALTAVSVVGSYFQERYWPALRKLADGLPQPAFAPYSSMGRLASDMSPDSIHRWLKQALARRTTPDDTHPSLTERLTALNEKPRLMLPAPGTAADRLLGAALERITRAFDERWMA